MDIDELAETTTSEFKAVRNELKEGLANIHAKFDSAKEQLEAMHTTMKSIDSKLEDSKHISADVTNLKLFFQKLKDSLK